MTYNDSQSDEESSSEDESEKKKILAVNIIDSNIVNLQEQEKEQNDELEAKPN
jgi:hypothetical protein